MSKKVLVTGGNGRCGNYMCTMLKDMGYKVTSLDNVPAGPDSANFKAGIPFVNADITNLGDCLRAVLFSEADVIVHLAGIPGPTELHPPYKDGASPNPFSSMQRQPEDNCFKVNTMGTYYMLEAARRLGVKDFIFASSYYATGIGGRLSGTSYVPKYLPVDEDHPCDPESSYGLSKYLDEVMGDSYARSYGMNVVGMRFMGVYYENSEMGRRMYKFGVNGAVAREMDKGKLINDSGQYVDARDIAVFTDLCIKKMGGEGWKPFEAFFVASDTIYVEDTAEVIAVRWPFLKDLAGNVKGKEGIFSIAKSEKMLGYKSVYTWRNAK